MSVNRRSRLQPRLLAVGIALVVAGLPLSACKEAEEESSAGYEPATLTAVKGAADDVHRITFTKEGAARTDLKTAKVTRSGKDTVVPYEALIYDDEGKTLVYTSPKPLSYLRKSVTVDRIEDDRVLLSEGPRVGTEVVTVGASEVYGTELEIAGSH